GRDMVDRFVSDGVANAKTGPVADGNVGGGAGMICYEFKGGAGTASRKLPDKAGGYVVGVLVQPNHGSRYQLQIAGVPVGKEIPDEAPFSKGPDPEKSTERGSDISGGA